MKQSNGCHLHLLHILTLCPCTHAKSWPPTRSDFASAAADNTPHIHAQKIALASILLSSHEEQVGRLRYLVADVLSSWYHVNHHYQHLDHHNHHLRHLQTPHHCLPSRFHHHPSRNHCWVSPPDHCHWSNRSYYHLDRYQQVSS